MNYVLEEVNKGTVGMCFKYGIFIGFHQKDQIYTTNDFPLMNLIIINHFLGEMKKDGQILDWMPADYFLKISEINFDYYIDK